MQKGKVWYQAGLAFACRACGRCCAGPDEGYVWVTKDEIKALADHLGMTYDDCKRQYVRRVGLRYSFKEQKPSNDCIFLQPGPNGKQCAVYDFRPEQCRTWPFWRQNLQSRRNWGAASRKCPGMDQGAWHSRSRIETVRDGNPDPAEQPVELGAALRNWLHENIDDEQLLAAVQETYDMLEQPLLAAGAECRACGDCCDFGKYGHRLYVTTLEMLYFLHGLRADGRELLPVTEDRCPYQQGRRCGVHEHRSSGCRIFHCEGLPAAFQGELSEQALKRLRQEHRRYNVPYYYTDLLGWLRLLQE